MANIDIQFSWKGLTCTATAVSPEGKVLQELQRTLTIECPTDFLVKYGDDGIETSKKAVEETLKNELNHWYKLHQGGKENSA
jgi:hypothetical protein